MWTFYWNTECKTFSFIVRFIVMQTICTKSVALQADDDDLMTSVSQSRYWPHISTNRFIGLTLPPSLLFATSCCPFVSFIVRNAPSPPPPHNPFLPSSPFFLLSPSLSARPATTQPLRPPLHPPPLCVCVLIWPCLAWIAVSAHLDQAQLVLPLKAECHYLCCLLSVLSVWETHLHNDVGPISQIFFIVPIN